jgi:hypothetical protein
MRVINISIFGAAFLLLGNNLATGQPVVDGLPASNNTTIFVICHGKDQRERVEAARALPLDLTRDEIRSLYCFLRNHPPRDAGNLAGLRFVKNEVLTALQNQNDPAPNLTELMIEIYRDHAQDFVTRDYAIQHLITWSAQGAPDAQDAKERIRATLFESAQRNDSVAGTALLGLHRLAKTEAGIQTDQIKSIALNIVQDPNSNEATRITAIQVCAEEQAVEAVPAIAILVQTRDRTALQLSAISALGQLGGSSEAITLRQLQSDQNKLLEPAIRAALAHLEHTIADRGRF